MKLLAALFLVLAFVSTAGANNAVSLGYTTEGTVIASGPDNCWGEEEHNHDGTFENGYAWQYGGCVPPYWGAFGEGMDFGMGYIGCAKLWVSTLPGYFYGQTCDVYIWEGGVYGAPDAVIGMSPGNVLGNVPVWPEVGENEVEIEGYLVTGEFTIGYWGNWPGLICAYFVGADLDGMPGHPWTYIAPGIGYPTGWNDPSLVWGPTQSLGIGVVFVWNSPVEAQSWGAIKAMFK